MRRIILESIDTGTVLLCDVNENEPIFAKVHGKLKGMIVKDDAGWMVRLGGSSGATGYHETLKRCIESCSEYGYEFFVG